MADVRRKAKWFARATAAMNDDEVDPFRDSEAVRWKNDTVAAEHRKAKTTRPSHFVREAVKVRFEGPRGPWSAHFGAVVLRSILVAAP